MQRSYNKYIFFLFFLLAVACKKENRCDCIKRTGDIVTEIRPLTTFSGIHVYDNVNVLITEDTLLIANVVNVEAGKNIEPLIITEVIDGVLHIKNSNRCNWTRSYKKAINVYIEIPLVTTIKSEGSGKISSVNTITSEKIEVSIFGYGDMELTLDNYVLISHVNDGGVLTLHGKSQSHDSDVKNSAFLIAGDYIANYTWIHATSTGESTINVMGTLDYEMNNIGDIYCYGKPNIRHATETSSGTLILK